MRQNKSHADYDAEVAQLARDHLNTAIDTCTVQAHVGVSDGGGGFVEEWADIPEMTNIPCYLSKHRMQEERIVSETISTTDRFVFHLEANTPIKIEHRIRCQGEIYNVTNVFDPTSGSPLRTVYTVLK